MLSPRWKKVVRDITGNRARTILVIASIVVGIFAVGVVLHIRTVVISEMQIAYAESNAAHATIYAPGIDDDLLEVIRRMPNIATAQGKSVDRKSTRLNSSHYSRSRMPSSA